MKAKGNSTRGNPKTRTNAENDPKNTKPGIKNWSTQKRKEKTNEQT